MLTTKRLRCAEVACPPFRAPAHAVYRKVRTLQAFTAALVFRVSSAFSLLFVEELLALRTLRYVEETSNDYLYNRDSGRFSYKSA